MQWVPCARKRKGDLGVKGRVKTKNLKRHYYLSVRVGRIETQASVKSLVVICLRPPYYDIISCTATTQSKVTHASPHTTSSRIKNTALKESGMVLEKKYEHGMTNTLE